MADSSGGSSESSRGKAAKPKLKGHIGQMYKTFISSIRKEVLLPAVNSVQSKAKENLQYGSKMIDVALEFPANALSSVTSTLQEDGASAKDIQDSLLISLKGTGKAMLQVLHESNDLTNAPVIDSDADDDFSEGEYLVVDPATDRMPVKVKKAISQKVTELFESKKAVERLHVLQAACESGSKDVVGVMLNSYDTQNEKQEAIEAVHRNADRSNDLTDALVIDSDANDDFSDGEYLVVDPATYCMPVKVKKVTSRKIIELFESEKVYRSTTPRGRALIINNWLFDIKMSNSAWSPDQTECSHRDGTQMDKINIKELLDQLGFITEIKEDVNSTDFETVIKEETGHPDHMNYGAFVLVIMTHGRDNELFGVDGRSYPIQKIYDLLSLHQFPAMGSKPKIVFLQACSGNRVDRQSLTSDGAAVHDDVVSHDSADSPVNGLVEKFNNYPKVNNMDDIAVVSSSFKGYDSKRHPLMGTWFIRAVVEVLMKHAHHKEFKELIREVRRRVREEGLKKENKDGGQTVTMRDECLNNDFYFFPGL